MNSSTTAPPERLNGNLVVKRLAHEACVTVMVNLRDNPTTPYVVATWWPDLKTSWMWGHYCADIREADLTFDVVAKRNETRG